MDWLKVKHAIKAPVDTAFEVKGWVRSRRDSKADGGISFLAISDGTCFDTLQVVARKDLSNYDAEVLKLTTGCAVEVIGNLVASQGKGQAVELIATEIKVPVAAKRHSFEFLREVAHLRPRTNTFGAVARVRHCLSASVHRFFDERDFYYIHTPIITASDCEGAGEMFRVSTLDLQNLTSSAGRPT